MKKKKGFTLVELLAVIVILAVILVIAMPKISEVIKKTRLSSLEATTKMIINSAEKKYTENQVLDNSSAIKCSDVAKLNDTDYESCNITFDDKGNASVILNGKKDGKFDNLTCSGTKGNITCSEGQTKITLKCVTGKTSLTQGDKYVNGQYTYTYNGSTGWGVVLTDKKATTPVTTELCGSIDNKPIVSMNSMFQYSKATSLDLSSFDTSNVTDMSSMFSDSQATSLVLSSFDTSKVTNMSSMFSRSQVKSLDLSSFDTSNVTDMSYMFWESQATSLVLSSFNTCNVENMNGMFSGSQVKSLDLSSFYTINVTNMSEMFRESQATSLDLSGFDTSNVTDMYGMFIQSHATTGYARTCEDAARFNATYKPDILTFTVRDTTC